MFFLSKLSFRYIVIIIYEPNEMRPNFCYYVLCLDLLLLNNCQSLLSEFFKRTHFLIFFII